VDFKRKDLIVKGKQYTLYLWDTAGQEIYKNVTKSYYQNAHACLVLYDITQRETFNSVGTWVEQFGNNSATENPTVVIIGNKKDLSEKRQVSIEEGKKMGESLKCMFYECSVKQSQEEIDEVFNSLIVEIVGKVKTEEPKIVLEAKIKEPKKGGCC
jgi:small GTP-binding protein